MPGTWNAAPMPMSGPCRFDDPPESEEPAPAASPSEDEDAPGPGGWATPEGCPR